MRISILLTCILWVAAPALGTELLVVQSVRDVSATELLKSVTRAVAADVELLVLSDYAEVDLPRIVREEQPDVILAVGEGAFKATGKIRGVPVVAVMALSLGGNRSLPVNVTGIEIRIDPARYMTLFKALGVKRIGVLYDPAQSGAYLAKARHAADQAGIELALRPAKTPREGLKELASLKGNASDALWLISDPASVSPLNLEAAFIFSLEQTKPVISYSGEHLSMGATVALEPEWSRMGLQAGELVTRLLEGAKPRDISIQPPRGFSLKSNDTVLTHLGINGGALEKLFPRTRK